MEIGDRVKTYNGTEGVIESMDEQFIYVRDDFDSLVVTKLSDLIPIGDTKITEQEYEAIIAEQDAEIRILKEKINNANHKKLKTLRAFCDSLDEKYSEYVGKKVKITFLVPIRWHDAEPKEIVGFLHGFKEFDYRHFICPDIAKVKKDGTESLNHYNDWQTECYKHITNIELVE